MATIERRVTKAGKIVFRVKVRRQGAPVQTAIFHRLTDAKKWAQVTEGVTIEGCHFKTVAAKRHTLGEMVERYQQEVLPQKSSSSIAMQTIQLQWWKSYLGDRPLARLTPALLADYRDRLARGEERSRSNASAPSPARLCQSGAGPAPGSLGQIPGTACCAVEGNANGAADTGRCWAAMRPRDGIAPRDERFMVGADVLSRTEGHIRGAEGHGPRAPIGVADRGTSPGQSRELGSAYGLLPGRGARGTTGTPGGNAPVSGKSEVPI